MIIANEVVVFTKNGLIGKSGKWYPCGISDHLSTAVLNNHDRPFAIVRTHFGDSTAEFEEYYTTDRLIPTRAQVAALFAWCTHFGKNFDDVTDCWDLPWVEWRSER